MRWPSGESYTGISISDLPSSVTPVTIPLTEADADRVADLYTSVFISDEPTTRFHAPDSTVFLPYARHYVRTLVSGNLSFISLDERTNDLAGFIFCVDLTTNPADEGPMMREFLSLFHEAILMIDELEDRFFERDDLPPGSVLHIFQLGVSPMFRGAGIAQDLIHRVIGHAHNRGFTQIIADCTSQVSKRAFERCGFYEIGFIPYDSFSIDGNRFFAGLDGGISLMVKDF